MKLFYFIIILFFLNHCSFDNKSGIWENENVSKYNKENIFKEFKKISTSENVFYEIIPFKNNYIFNTTKGINNKKWNDIFYNSNNNLKNFSYNNLNQLNFKSKKLTKYRTNHYKLYENGNLIINDINGNIIIFSISKKKIISKFNFYKKKYKKIKKKLNLIVENKIIFTADNLGFVYAYNYEKNKIIWAKNFKIPFSSNLKIIKNKLVVSNQDNNLYILNKKNGDLLKLIPTEETPIKNQFKNNLSANKDKTLYFLNSFGSLYSINIESITINWFNNFNQSFNLSPANLFFGNKIVNTDNEIIVSSNMKTFIINSSSGSVIKKFNFSSKTKPIIINNIVFFLTDNNLLIALNLETKNILYSYDISKNKEFKIKNIENIPKQIMVMNNEIFIFLKNSKTLIFGIDGQFKRIQKLSSKIYSSPISIDGSILYLNNNNRLMILN